MPMPPILNTIDWNSVFHSGQNFAEWLEASKENNQKLITDQMAALTLSDDVVNQLDALAKPVHIVAIAEDWCGDVVRHVPVLECLAKQNDLIKTSYITREENKDIFVRYLTNGGEAIPKFIFLSDAFVECGNWGPMPQRYKDLIARGKACGDVASARAIIMEDYKNGADRDHTIAELVRLLDIAGAASVA